MELKQLQYFVTSVDMGSFKKAADALYTTQPHVSKTIKALEDDLGICLLERHATGVRLTEVGKQVYADASDILLKCGKLAQLEQTRSGQPLRLSSYPSAYIATLTAQFCSQWERVPLDVMYCESRMEDMLQQLHRHEIDLAIISIARRKLEGFRQLMDKKRLRFEELKQVSPYLFVGQKHPLFQETKIDASVLNSVSLVQTPPDLFPVNLQTVFGQDTTVDGLHRIETNSIYLSQCLTKHGIVCRMGCPWMDTVEPDMRAIPIVHSDEKISVGYLCRKRNDLSDAEQSFLQFLEVHMKNQST